MLQNQPLLGLREAWKGWNKSMRVVEEVEKRGKWRKVTEKGSKGVNKLEMRGYL